MHNDELDINMIEHINYCQKCRTEIELYESLFSAIKKEPIPVFEFDIANLVIQQLPVKQNFSFEKYLIAVLSGISIALFSILIYFTTIYFPTVFNGISTIQFSLILVTIVLISIFIYFDMNKNYKNLMNFSWFFAT